MAKATQTQKPFVFGLDIGYSNVKMAYGYAGMSRKLWFGRRKPHLCAW